MIVVADDFGWTTDINAAVERAFALGLVTHSSVMTTMEAFDDACAIVERLDLVDRIGVHLVLSEGEPLTDEIKRCARLCSSDGAFRARHRLVRLDAREEAAVAAEIRAQVGCVRARGIRVVHLDSHHHIHNEPAIAGIVLSLARELGIPRVRISLNAARRGLPRRLFKAAVNARIRRAGLAGTRWAGSADDLFALAAYGCSGLDDFELVMHPVISDGRLLDAYGGDEPLDSIVGRARELARQAKEQRRTPSAVRS